eukprot:69337_1
MDKCKKWCSVCYHNNKNTIGICDADSIDQHYYKYHHSIRNTWPRAFNVTFKNNAPYLFDDVPCKPPNKGFEGAEIFLRHEKRDDDIVNRLQFNTAYAIAFYKKPFRSAHNNYDWSIHTLWSTEMDGLFVVRISELIPKYPLLKEKLDREYPDVMNDVHNRSPPNLDQLSFKHKALQIIKEIKRCATWVRPFLRPVKELEDCAPNYYKIITNPMDLTSLTELINNKTIHTKEAFADKLQSIWSNCKKFNPSTHKIHKAATNCKKESNRLINKYFPDLFRESQTSEHAIVNYQDGIRRSLSCPKCNAQLRFFNGFHSDCTCFVGFEEPNQCVQCDVVLKDTSIGYYHCVSGCESDDHDLFLCEVCAAKDYDSKQIESVPFNGLWVSLGVAQGNDFFYEAILCRQDANRVFFKLVFHTDADVEEDHEFEETGATITCTKPDAMAFEVDKEHQNIVSTLCRLNSDHSQISFVNSEDNTDISYDKVSPVCKECGSNLYLMQKNVRPSVDDRSRFCDVHEIYYNKFKKAISKVAFYYDDKSKKSISNVAFYFTCFACKNFDICAGCILVKTEKEWKQRHDHETHANTVISRTSKKRKRAFSASPSPKKRKIKSKTVKKKQKNNETIRSMTVDRKRKINSSNTLEMDICDANEQSKPNYNELMSLYLKEQEKNRILQEALTEAQSKFNRLHSTLGQMLVQTDKPQGPQFPV